MFSLFCFQNRKNQDILSSKLYSEQDFYGYFIKDLKHAKKSVVIESPFLTESRSHQLAHTFRKLIKRGVKVVVYTRKPQHQPYRMRAQAFESIYILSDAGVKVYECGDYRHRKVAIIDKQKLWEGSLNIFSQAKSRELMRRIDSPLLAKQMLHIISR